MKRKSYFFIILYVMIVISLCSTNVSYATKPAPFVDLDPSSGEIGITITVTGGNFKKNDIATITYDGVTVATVYTGNGNTGGAFSINFTIPASASGAHTVRATDAHGSTASATFTVIPTASMSPTTGAVGSSVTVTGKGVTGSATVNIKYDGTTVTTSTSDSTGSFSTSFNVPHSVTGIHTVSVTDGINSGSGPFTVAPSAILNSTSGSVGNTVRVSGLGYAASSTVTIQYDSTTLATTPGTVTTNSTGGFTATVTIPSSTLGSHTIKATDASGNTDSHTFTVTASTQSISLNPLTGAVASTVTVSGNSFTAPSTITIQYDGTTLATTPGIITTNSTGGFTATILVPSSSSGSHTIQVTDASSKSASQTYTVAPFATMSPVAGQVGVTVSGVGHGYASSSTVTVYFDGSSVTTASTNSSGSFSASFSVPNLADGRYVIKSSDGQNSNSGIFTITLDPLTPNNPVSTGAIGGNSARGTFSSSAFSAQEFLGYSSLSSSARDSILNQDPNVPLPPSNDPSIPFYPLQIGDNKYLIARYSNTIQTVTENVGSPINMQLRSVDRSVSHVEFYMNFQGSNKEIQDSDTFIIYDKDLPLQIKDPHGYFSNVKVNIMSDDKISKIDTSITFAKSMEKSNIIIREWNAERYASTTKINDALEVQPNPNITTFKDDLPKNTIVEKTPLASKATTNPDITSYIKQWGGYSPVSISDSELLVHMGINANHIPSWFMKTVKWIDSGDSTSEDFSNAIKFMYQNKIIK